MQRRYHDRIYIQRPARVENSAGQVVYGWSYDHTVSPWVAFDRWASVMFKGGSETTRGTQRQPTAQWEIVLPWDPDAADISPEMRVLFPDELVAIELDSVRLDREGRRQIIVATGWQDFDFDFDAAEVTPFPWPEIETDSTDLLLLESEDYMLTETSGRILI